MHILPRELGISVSRFPDRSSSVQLCRFPISSGSVSSAFSDRSSVCSAASCPMLCGRPLIWFFMAEKKVSLVSRPMSSGSPCKLLWHTKRLVRLASSVMQEGRTLKLLKLRSRWTRLRRCPNSWGKNVSNPLRQAPTLSLACPPARQGQSRKKSFLVYNGFCSQPSIYRCYETTQKAKWDSRRVYSGSMLCSMLGAHSDLF